MVKWVRSGVMEAGAEIHGENSIDELGHDRRLNDLTHEAMSYVLEKMRRPIADWLAMSARDTGQNTAPAGVRGFVRKWRARVESNHRPQD